MIETANNKIGEEKTPWWLTEESLLGNVKLDYSVENVPSTSAIKEEKKVTNYLITRDNKPAVLERKLLVTEDDTKKAEVNKKINTRTARIPRKKCLHRVMQLRTPFLWRGCQQVLALESREAL